MSALAQDGARIGPNAILQHLPVLDDAIGEPLRGALLHRAGVEEPPLDAGMLPQAEVARLHNAVRLFLPDRAAAIQRAAGLAVGDYILAHRIPKLAQRLIRALPSALGARLLAMAITKHAWTFAGSGAFRVLGYGPLRVEIRDNPLAIGPADAPICHWHAAVFERLFGALVWPDLQVIEEHCIAMGAPACIFRIAPR
ncbi:MAG: bacteriochlorophyll 4-vinyl reductase [Alphaproteobacteria bacterium]|jgi:divinyl protochlorophyllide a 8-vinyl-reductase|nr:bacteriochlorophyll 4-vinyl reductase [Alphaproteobacteria bacterium]